MNNSISYELAAALVGAAIAETRTLGVAGAAAVVDTGGHLIAFGRCDGASFLAVDVTRRKALTAVCLGLPTKVLGGLSAADPVVGADILKQPDLCAVPGGVPIRIGGQVVGGLGVAGGRSEQDHIAAEAALAKAVPGPRG